MIVRRLGLALALGWACSAPVQATPLAAANLGRMEHAAAAGDARAQFDLGRLYRNGIGVVRDSARSHALIRSAAQQHNPAAMFILSNMLIEGEGTPRDLAEARKWLEAAAELEYPEALLQLSLNFQDGAMGYEPDQARAAQLMREAAHAMKHRAHRD